MNAPRRQLRPERVRGLADAIAMALAEMLPPDHPLRAALTVRAPPGATSGAVFDAAFQSGPGVDSDLLAAARSLDLGQADILAIALTLELERDARLPAALRAIQGDAFGPWPSLSLIWRLLDRVGRPALTPERALALGILVVVGERAPGPEQRLALSPAALRALTQAPETVHADAPEEWHERASELACRIAGRRAALILRQGEPEDRQLYARMVAHCLSLRPEPLAMEETALGAACRLGRWLPIETLATVSGRRTPVLALDGLDGPRALICNREGGALLSGWDPVEVPLPTLSVATRRRLWARALPGEILPASLPTMRFGLTRIATTGARAAMADPAPLNRRLRAAMGSEFQAEMEPHATLVAAETGDADFAANEALKADLEVLLSRCRFRAAPSNPVPGVRALLSGPSGAGKTLACSWLASRLCLPLFRVDLSSVVSKYIGETEENIARLLDRAETGDMVLLLDEADSLFASRTETRDSSDRFANNQTNYLLSRIEAFDGIAILTSNGPERIDAAFTRRLDQVIEVPLPAPPERRAIWQAHLPEGHGLSTAEVNRLAGLVDLAGGYIRNIAQTARVLAGGGRPATWPDLLRATELEYRKLGRSMPGGLSR